MSIDADDIKKLAERCFRYRQIRERFFRWGKTNTPRVVDLGEGFRVRLSASGFCHILDSSFGRRTCCQVLSSH